MIPSPRAETCLFAQFALRAFQRRFRAIAASGRHLAQPSADGMAILRQHRDRAVVIQSDNRAGARMAHDGKVNGHAIGQRRVLHANIDDA